MPQIVLPKDVDSKFRFITVAAQRAKQIQNGAKPRVEASHRKSTHVAMEEVVANAISWEVRDEGEVSFRTDEEVAEAGAVAEAPQE